MARRKSHWQQFADNFDSTYKTFNTMFSDIEEGKIMADEVTELQSGIGPGPRSQQLWSYGGKTYDKEITPDMLRGLRNKRLIDNMAKWGDTEGAMKLEQAQAGIDATLASTEATKQQNELFAKTFQDRVSSFGLANQQTEANIGLTLANKERILAIYPVEKRKMVAESLGLEWDNKYDQKTFDFRVEEQEAKTSSSVSQAKKDEIEADELERTSHMRVLSDISEYNTNISDDNLGQKQNQVLAAEADESILVNDMMVSFRKQAKNGVFENNEQAKEWMVNEMYKINPTLADDLKSNYGANELANITQESTLFTKKAEAAWKSGGINKLAKTIDDLNGVNTTEIVYNDKNENIATLWEVDEKGVQVREIATGNLKDGSFLMNLQQTLDPARSMAISKEYYDNLKIQADIAYTEAMAEKAEADKNKSLKETELLSSSKPLGKDEYFVQRLITDPNDTVALHGLLGLDLTREEIDDMVLNETLRQNENNTSNGSGGANYDKDGLNAGKTRETKTESVAGTQGVTEIQIDPSASEDDQAKQLRRANGEIRFRVKKVQSILDKDIIPRTRDSQLPAKDKAEQVLRDIAREWLKKNKNYFLSNPKQLADFEANPEQWVKDNITSKGIGG